MNYTQIDLGFGTGRILKTKKHAVIIAQIKGYKAQLLGDRTEDKMTEQEHKQLISYTSKICKK